MEYKCQCISLTIGWSPLHSQSSNGLVVITVLDGLTAALIQTFLDHRELAAQLLVASGALASELIVESLGGTLAPLSKRAFQ